MELHQLTPFANESDSLTLDALVIENRLDRIEMYGNLQITRDKPGLALALSLKGLLDETIRIMQAGPLPDSIEIDPPDDAPNPFA